MEGGEAKRGENKTALHSQMVGLIRNPFLYLGILYLKNTAVLAD